MAKDKQSIYDFMPHFEQMQLKEFYGSTKYFGFDPKIDEYVTFTTYANGETFYKPESYGGEGPGELIFS